MIDAMSRDRDQPTLPDDNRRALRLVARACRKATLATLLEDGAPYASLVTVAFDHDLSPILLLSGLADHTRNLDRDDRCSLLLDGTDGHPNPQTGPRVTLTGRAERVAEDGRLRARFLARHPGAAMYAGFGDFAIWRIAAERAHFVGGFGRAVWFPAPFGLRPETVAALAAAEAALLEEANAGRSLPAGWRVAALDTEGADLVNADQTRRLWFGRSIETAEQARAALAESLSASFG